MGRFVNTTKLSIGTLAMSASWVLCIPAQAETLDIGTLYPAAVRDAATLHTVSVDRFDGSDGIPLGFAIETNLAGASIDDVPYFEIIDGRASRQADGIISGGAQTNVEFFTDVQTREKCVERDENKKCVNRVKYKIICTRRIIHLESAVRLSRTSDGKILYSRRIPKERESVSCPDSGYGDSVENRVAAMVNQTALEVRLDLAPHYLRERIRVNESTTGLPKPLAQRYKYAVKLTKRDQAGACEIWNGMGQNWQTHFGLFYNMALCAEQRGDMDQAQALFQSAGRIDDKQQASSSLQRLNKHVIALEDMAVHRQITGDVSSAIGAEKAR